MLFGRQIAGGVKLAGLDHRFPRERGDIGEFARGLAVPRERIVGDIAPVDIAIGGRAALAFAAFPARRLRADHHRVAHLPLRDAGPHFGHHPRAFVAQHDRDLHAGDFHHVHVAVAQAGAQHAHFHFAFARRAHFQRIGDNQILPIPDDPAHHFSPNPASSGNDHEGSSRSARPIAASPLNCAKDSSSTSRITP